MPTVPTFKKVSSPQWVGSLEVLHHNMSVVVLTCAALLAGAVCGCTLTATRNIAGAPYKLMALDPTAICAVHDPSIVEEVVTDIPPATVHNH